MDYPKTIKQGVQDRCIVKVRRLLKVLSSWLLFKLKCRQILVDYFVCHQVQVVAMQLQQSSDKKWDTCVEMLTYTFVYKAYG